MARQPKRNYQAEMGKKLQDERATIIDELLRCKDDFNAINQCSYSGSCENTVIDMKKIADAAFRRVDKIINWTKLIY